MSWTAQQNITLRFIQPGNPQQNAYIERYNRTVRYDWLGQYRLCFDGRVIISRAVDQPDQKLLGAENSFHKC